MATSPELGEIDIDLSIHNQPIPADRHQPINQAVMIGMATHNRPGYVKLSLRALGNSHHAGVVQVAAVVPDEAAHAVVVVERRHHAEPAA